MNVQGGAVFGSPERPLPPLAERATFDACRRAAGLATEQGAVWRAAAGLDGLADFRALAGFAA